jgi:hypothetical protein
MADTNVNSKQNFFFLPEFMGKDEVTFTISETLLSNRTLHHHTFNYPNLLSTSKESDEYIEKATTVINYPEYKSLCASIRKEVESILKIEIYPSYYVNHYYNVGAALGGNYEKRNREYTLCLQISSNLTEKWPLKLINRSNELISLNLQPGDAVLYKGLELASHTSPLPSRYNPDSLPDNETDDTYCHRMFFNFVDADGYHLEYAYVG